jgi:Protein of unknown function (DUF3225)
MERPTPRESPTLVNDPEIIAELQVLSPKYAAVFMNKDSGILTRMFWASPPVMRFGVTENLHEIEAPRQSHSPEREFAIGVPNGAGPRRSVREG